MMKTRFNFSLETIARCLLVVAAAISAYLGWQSLGGSAIAGCGDGAACSQVLSSPWAKVFGLPVAILGSLIYVATALLVGRNSNGFRSVALGLEIMILLAAVWFVSVQIFAVGQICAWCCSAHLLASVAAILLISRRQQGQNVGWQPAVGALVAVIALAVVQSFGTNSAGENKVEPIVAQFDLGDPQPAGDQVFLNEVSLLDGQVTFKLDELPLVGVSAPTQVVFALTDYTCPHCRQLHDVLQEVGQRLNNEVAILKLPATRKGTESAVVHRHMLALWKVSPKMHWALERSLIEGRVAATSEAVQAEAIRLVGRNQFAEANVRHNGWISEQLAKTRKVQDANREASGKGTLPQLMVGSELIIGAHSNPEFYLAKIADQFGTKTIASHKPAKTQLKDGVVRVGEVSAGQTAPFTVTFANATREPMEISWINMGAGISLGKFTRDEIFPDDVAELTFELSIPEDARPGMFHRTVTVNTSTGHDPLSFRVVASVGATIAHVETPPGE